MDRAQIRVRLRELEPWFHKIDLGKGISTKSTAFGEEPPDHPLGTWRTVGRCLPRDLNGKTVLDIGCNAGFYSIQAKKRGAARVLGLEVTRLGLRQANFVKEVLGIDVDYERISLYDVSSSTIGQFDVTLALGLIYHCKHIVLGLEKLFEVTKELLILESAILSPEATPDFSHLRFGHHQAPLFPLAYVGDDIDGPEALANWFLPSPQCLREMLIHVGFDEVEIFRVFDNRVVLMARKQAPFLASTRPAGLSARLALEKAPHRCRPGAELHYVAAVVNTGLATWPEETAGPRRGVVYLGCHLLDETKEVVVWENARARLPNAMNPGDCVEIEVRVQAPMTPGAYFIEFDMVSEEVAWFEDTGSATVVSALVVDRSR